MTQFMLSVHHAPGARPYATDADAQAAFEATAAFNDRLLAADVLVFAGALLPEAHVVTPAGVTAGPAHGGRAARRPAGSRSRSVNSRVRSPGPSPTPGSPPRR